MVQSGVDAGRRRAAEPRPSARPSVAAAMPRSRELTRRRAKARPPDPTRSHPAFGRPVQHKALAAEIPLRQVPAGRQGRLVIEQGDHGALAR